MAYKVLAICGSIRKESANLHLINAIAALAKDTLDVELYEDLGMLPHFDPDCDEQHTPLIVAALRKKIEMADGVLVCTPEYVFTLPGSFKNAIEWCVATTVFSQKPVALITASGLGEKAHEALQLVMKTIEAKFDEHTQLHIRGVRSKVDKQGVITDNNTLVALKALTASFIVNIAQAHT
ncbi:MAG: NAD(P)H-dependent oxidoreductase [Taibaiella sp.]|nr:NAD(P)H-dependent oxidoreductase [Taibaiella sp.]